MIERYSIGATNREIANRFLVDVPEYYRQRYNAAPSQILPVITAENPNGVSMFYWGLPPAKQTKNKTYSERTINLKVESIQERVVFRRAIQSRRCLILGDGFYGWKHIGKKTIIPYRFSSVDRMPFGIAGIWEEYEDFEGENCHTFMMITATSNLEFGITERMPLVLSHEKEKIWLSAETDFNSVIACLEPHSIMYDVYPISPRINSVLNDDIGLISPTPPSDQFGNLTLFE